MISDVKRCVFLGLATFPVLSFGFSTGPPQARTGNAADGGLVCIACHRGGDLNDGRGSVRVTTGAYTPGQRQTIMVRLEHPDAMRWGFQLTARELNNPLQKAGTFVPASDIRIRCGVAGNQDAPCGESDREFVSHIAASTAAGTAGGRTWMVEWTAPAATVGPIVFYVAGNAANNGGTNAGDFIYTNATTVAPLAAAVTRAAITRGGVADAFNYTTTGIANHSWVAIVGTNLASATAQWDNAINSGILPASLIGTAVKINNKDAPIFYASPTQLNVLAPTDDATGDVSVVVNNGSGDSDPVTIRRVAAAPALFAPGAQNNRFFVTAVATDGALLGKPGVSQATSRAVRPGETILLFGSGFGATNPGAPADRAVSGSPELTTKPVIRIGDVMVTFPGNGNLVAGGLYQFNVTIPATVPEGDQPIVAEVGGVRSSASVFITIAR